MPFDNFFLNLSNENKGFIYGFFGILIFSITPVATKIALGPNNSQLSAEFITFGRSTLAGFLSLSYLLTFKKKIPKKKDLLNFSTIAFCLSVVFPLTLSFGLTYSTSIHAGVILAFLPLATAIFASFYFKQKASKSFWLCAFFGSIIVVIYILLHNENSNIIFEISHYDILFCIAVIAAAVGYNFGAKLTKVMTAPEVISWALVLAMPVHFGLAIYYFPKIEINIISWLGFLYVAIFSQWIGFFAWYKGLDLGGAVRVSQIQLLMPFFTFAFSIYLLGETLDFVTIIFSIAIILLIYLSRKMAITKK
jgi:drug/metabolite transporter (DMT)-like permease